MRKIQYLALGLSVSCLLFTGCGAKSAYRNPVTGEVMEESVSESSSEEKETESQSVEEPVSETVEETETEISTEAIETIESEQEEEINESEIEQGEFNLEETLGGTITKNYSNLGITYTIYENGAEIRKIENSAAIIQEEIEYEGVKYPVIALSDVWDEAVEFEIPKSIKCIMERAFSECNIENLVIPDTVEFISGRETFYNCKNLKSVTFPKEYATDSSWYRTFKNCSSLEAVEVPLGVDFMEETFFGCSNLSSVTLPDSLTAMKNDVFRDCICLEKIIIPESVQVIATRVFEASGLKELEIPETVEYITLDIFYGCFNLEEIWIPDTVKDYTESLQHWIKGCTNLKTFKYSNSMNNIKMLSGIECPNLELIIFPDSITDLKDNIFDNIADKSKLTIQVPEEIVEYLQRKFPEINVVAKE